MYMKQLRTGAPTTPHYYYLRKPYLVRLPHNEEPMRKFDFFDEKAKKISQKSIL